MGLNLFFVFLGFHLQVFCVGDGQNG
jgi:hypothetical protein